jgi:hypothetical protein
MLIKSSWNQAKTFKLIPILEDCPYNEAIYDPEQKILAVISKMSKDTLQMVPKFNDKGDVQYLKSPRENGKPYAEERRTLDTWYEYYIEDPEDIKKFVNYFVEGQDDILEAFKFINAPKVAQIEDPTMFPGVQAL